MLYLEEPLNTRFDHVRSEESAIGNFAADLMRKEHCADVSIFCGGGIRADKIYPKGFLKYEAYSEMFPFPNPVMLVEATGEEILQALENGVSKYPALDGRFPQVSGISFTFDPNRPPLQRILLESVKVDESPIDLKKKYRLAIPKYIAAGKDGYDVLINCPKIVDLIVAPIFKDLFDEFVSFVQNKKTFEEFKLWSIHQESFVKGKLLDISLQNRLQEELHNRLINKEGSKKQRLFFKPIKNRRRSEGQIMMKEISVDFAIGIHSHHQKSLFAPEGANKSKHEQDDSEPGLQEFILKPATSTFEQTSMGSGQLATDFVNSSTSGGNSSSNPAAKPDSLGTVEVDPNTVQLAGSLEIQTGSEKCEPQAIPEVAAASQDNEEDDEDSSRPSTRYFKIEEALAETSQEQIKEGSAVLGHVLLKRLRKYRLLAGAIESPNAKHSQTQHLATLRLVPEGRIKMFLKDFVVGW